MHEMSLVRNIVDVVLAECQDKGVIEVRAVNLVVGELRDLLDDYVPDLFRYLARGTVAQNAQVAIRRVPLTVMCHECGDIFPIEIRNPETWSCPRCGAHQKYRIFTGNELGIESIEVKSETEIDDATIACVA